MSDVSEPVLDLCGQAARRASGRNHFRAMAAAVIEEYLRATERRDGEAAGA